MRKHQVPVAMRPVKTFKSLLVHPKHKQEKEEITDCIYKIPCASCEKCYIGETGRKFGTRLKEHKTEVESITIIIIIIHSFLYRHKVVTSETSEHQVCLSRTNQH